MSFNLQSAICGLQSAVCGLRSAVCSLQSAVCSLQMSSVIHRKKQGFVWGAQSRGLIKPVLSHSKFFKQDFPATCRLLLPIDAQTFQDGRQENIEITNENMNHKIVRGVYSPSSSFKVICNFQYP